MYGSDAGTNWVVGREAAAAGGGGGGWEGVGANGLAAGWGGGAGWPKTLDVVVLEGCPKTLFVSGAGAV